jgi:tRNA uridine 5-carbamoylmethylation protein Kti12
MPGAIVLINGYPGVGKHIAAEELAWVLLVPAWAPHGHGHADSNSYSLLTLCVP